MQNTSELITMQRDCEAILIPSGDPIKLIKGTHVRITQSLGGDYTLFVNVNLVKVSGAGEKRVESLRIADIFRARAVDSTSESFVFELTGTTGKVDAFIELMEPLGLIEIARTGVVGIARGASSHGIGN